MTPAAPAPICSLSLVDDAESPGELDDAFASADLGDGFSDAMPAMPMVFSLPLVDDADDSPLRIAG